MDAALPSRLVSTTAILAVCLAVYSRPLPAETGNDLLSADAMFLETDGLVAVEAEHFARQTLTETREWVLHSSEGATEVRPDGDDAHVAGASGGAYLEVLPDTRRTHDDKLIRGENFSNEAGQLAVLHYRVHFQNAGRYYVWVRGYSTGTEDNGLHVGIDGDWPAHGQRMQWCEGKRTWRWESKQRTNDEHCGVPHEIYVDVDQPGSHEIMFSMREDGFEFDKFLLTSNRDFARPGDEGPGAQLHEGQINHTFAYVKTPAAPPASADTPPASADTPPASADTPSASGQEDGQDGDGTVTVSGEMKLWHKITLSLDGPFAKEADSSPNPFTDYRLTATFEHADSGRIYRVPGYFAADGNAADTGAQQGTCWRVHFSPDLEGVWQYTLNLDQGSDVALGGEGASLDQYNTQGQIEVLPSDKTRPDFRSQGRLSYVKEHYLKFAGSEEYFLKMGPDAPETLLGYADFDGTEARKPNVPLKTWAPHVQDWREGNPTWRNGQGKGLIGALNYLSEKGCNTFSFLPYNAGGDGDNVWPFISRDDKFHYDCSKLDQWGIVFDHATSQGLHLHFKLQENEIDDNRRGSAKKEQSVPEALDGGKLGRERKLYCRELIARFGHALALNWNIGEENTQSAEEQRDMIRFLHDTDPYDHNIVIHTFPDQQDAVYPQLLGIRSLLTGASLQNSWSNAHERVLKWRKASSRTIRPWVVCNDEQNPASHGVPPDPGYQGHDGYAEEGGRKYNLDDIRKQCLWGTLMAGGAGVEYYFGYKLPENDLVCEDFRSRDKSWDYGRIAIDFFHNNDVPFWEMECIDYLAGGEGNYCFADAGQIYLVYMPQGGTSSLPISDASAFELKWFNPRAGGDLQDGDLVVEEFQASFAAPDEQDWLAVIRRR